MLARSMEPLQTGRDGPADAKLAAVFSGPGVPIEPKVGYRITVQFRYDTAKLGQPNTDPEGSRFPASGGESPVGLNGEPGTATFAQAKKHLESGRTGASEEYGRRLTMDAGATEKGKFGALCGAGKTSDGRRKC
jgi:hypothetical protein